MLLVENAAKCEDTWQKYDLSSSYLADFVLRELVGRKPGDYILRELFSAKAISALLEFCVMSVNANRRGVRISSFGANSEPRPLEEGRQFEILLQDWAQAGWISLTGISDRGEIAASVVMKT